MARFLLLPIAAFATFAGVRWLRVDNECIEVLAFSPDGSQFVGTRYTSNNVYSYKGLFVFDAQTGEKVCDLTKFFPDFFQIRWSTDGKRLAAVLDGTDNNDRGIVVVSLEESPPRLIKKLSDFQGAIPIGVMFDGQGRALVFQHKKEGIERGRIEVVDDDTVSKVIEYGRDEEFSQLRVVGKGCFVIGFDPITPPITKKKRDLVMTDGTSAKYLFIDLAREKPIELPNKPRLLIGNPEFFAEMVPAAAAGKQNAVIRRYRQPEEKLLTVPQENYWWTPFVTSDGERVLSYDYDFQNERISVHNLASGEKREFTTPAYSHAMPTPDGDCLLFTTAGKLIRLNLQDGSHRKLTNLRPFRNEWFVVAVTSLVFVWIVALVFGIRMQTTLPFFEMTCAKLLSWFVVIGWSALGTTSFLARTDIESTGFVFFGATLMFFVLWASTARSFWGVTLPCCLAGMAANVGIMFLWARGDGYRVVEGTMGSMFLMVLTVLGLWFVRRRFGRLTNDSDFENSTTADSAQSQVSLMQMLTIVGSVCLLFSVLRFVDPSRFIAIPRALVLATWLLTYAGAATFMAILASVSAFRIERTPLSLIASLLATSLFALSHHVLTRWWNIDLLWNVFTRYGLIGAIGCLIWVGSRYCRAKGHRFER